VDSDVGWTIFWWGVGGLASVVYGRIILASLRPPSPEAEAAWRQLSLATPPSSVRVMLRRQTRPLRIMMAGVWLGVVSGAFVGWWMSAFDDASLIPALVGMVASGCGAGIAFRGLQRLSGDPGTSRMYDELGLQIDGASRRLPLRANGERHGREVQVESGPHHLRISIECPLPPADRPEGARHENGRLIVERQGKRAGASFLAELLAAERACNPPSPVT
jgi:hypothetical protein